MWYSSILETIGQTPLVRLNKVSSGIPATVLAKVESFNPGNSIKDRIALKMIQDAEKDGRLKPGGTIIEGTSGNTGMGLAIAAIVKGYKCIFTTNDKQSKEKVDALRAFGAEVIICPTAVAADDPRSYYSVASKLNKEIPNSFYPNQYDNLSNTAAHYETTGPEIWEQTEGKITHLVVGVGTGGTICGTGKFLKEKNPNIKILGIDTYGSVFKKYHETGEFDEKEIYPYITEGIGEDILPKNVDFKVIDHFEKVTDKDAALMTRELVSKEGIWAGNSAGAAVAGLLQMKDRFKQGDVVVVIFHDHGSRYVNKFFNDDWMRDRGFLKTDKPTAGQILSRKKTGPVIGIEESETVSRAIGLMRSEEISQLPVMQKGNVVGSITESMIFQALIKDEKTKSKQVKDLMGPVFPYVGLNDPVDKISALINRKNPAVLVRDSREALHIITEYDVVGAVAGLPA